MNLGSEKDLRMFGVELRSCYCKAFFSFSITILFLKLALNKEKGGGMSTLGGWFNCVLNSGVVSDPKEIKYFV